MKKRLFLLLLLAGCASPHPLYIGDFEPGRGHNGYVIREKEFSNRLEYLRFCDRYWTGTAACID